jgi:hypothetical protein
MKFQKNLFYLFLLNSLAGITQANSQTLYLTRAVAGQVGFYSIFKLLAGLTLAARSA